MIKTTTAPKPKASRKPKADAPVTTPQATVPTPPLVPEAAQDAPKKTPKLEILIALLRRADGATLTELMDASGWQAHSVRGALAGGIAKRLGAKVISEKIDGVRRYRAPTQGAHRLSASVEAQVARLETLDLEGLRTEWGRLYGPPKLRSVELLRRLIAWRMQAEAEPDAVANLKARLSNERPARTSSVLREGDVVYREWLGVRHEVAVLEDGKVGHAGKTYDSLSAVARAITGSRWNGPRFFGLRAEAKP